MEFFIRLFLDLLSDGGLLADPNLVHIDDLLFNGNFFAFFVSIENEDIALL